MENFKHLTFESTSSPDTTDTQSNYDKDYIQEDKKSFRCTFPNCGKVFKFKSEISRHTVIHFDSRPFPCPHEGCGKTFKRADALDTHMRIHTKEMPFECEFPECDKKFTTKAALRYHLLKHNNERAHKCPSPGCGKSFYTKGQLKQHEKAFNYHVDMPTPQIKEEPINAASNCVKNCEKEENTFYKNFYAPTPRLIQNIEWEIKNPEDENTHPEYQQESYENFVKYILKENKDSKDHISLYTKLVDKFQDDEEPDFILNTQQWPEPVQEPSVFFDENEFKILDFLKEQAHNGY